MRILRDGLFFSEGDNLAECAAIADEEASRYSFHIDDLASILVSENNAAFESAMTALTSEYPEDEIKSWDRQRDEAVAWEQNNLSPTPWIDIAAQTRGIDREVYLSRTAAKVHLFAGASAFLVGRRQAIDDAIKQATTSTELEAIVIDDTLPAAL